MLLVIPFAHYIKGKSWEFSYTFGPPIAVGVFILIEAVPTLIMHLIHLSKSRHFRITFNLNDRTVRFRPNKQDDFTFNFDELTIIEHLTLYQQNKNRLSTGWSNYSYLQISTSDNKEFQISSLILTKDQFPIEPTQTKYSFWPSISSAYKDHQPEIERTEQLRKSQIRDWKHKFEHLTLEELKSKLERPTDFDELPRTAMEELVKEKSY